MKSINISCPDCGMVVTGKYGFLFRKTMTCPSCNRIIDPRKDGIKAVSCGGCGNVVMFDTRKGTRQTCPVCNSSLADWMKASYDVECPNCHMMQSVKFDEVTHTCPICDTSFDAKKAKTAKDAVDTSKASVITVPANQDHVIWKHPQNAFPYASRVVVPQGYTALILRNGVCAEPSQPGSYLLSDTMRTMDEQLKYAVLEDNAQVSVDIFFVRKNMDKTIHWTDPMFPVNDKNGKIVGKLGFGGTITLDIVDAKMLADFVGYESAKASDLLSDDDNVTGRAAKLTRKVKSICFETAHKILMEAVFVNGFTYNSLNANRMYFKSCIQDKLDALLEKVGVCASIFSLDYIRFVEDEELVAIRTEEEQREENRKNIRAFFEHPFEWKSSEMKVHMKGDLTLYANLVFGGSLKFVIRDYNVLYQRSEVEAWIRNGVYQSDVSRYCAQIAQEGAKNVLGDIMQQMIDDTNADIRDLTLYYKYIRSRIQEDLSHFFAKYGLEVEQFSMEEKDRWTSPALQVKTSAAQHKTEAEIRHDVYEFDQNMRMRQKTVDVDTTLYMEDQSLREDTGKAAIYSQRVDLNMGKVDDDYRYKMKLDDLTKDEEMRKLQYRRGNELGEMEYQHQKEVIKSGYASENQMLAHESRVAGIDQKTEEEKHLHYQNIQAIEARAAEIRTQWESKSSLEYRDAQHQVAMGEVAWDNKKKMTMEASDLTHKVSESDAENRRIINNIMIKIAESDLDLQEKVDAYKRLLGNQKEDDNLRHMIESSRAKNDIYYADGHVRHLLTKEENDIMDEMTERQTERQESLKNADFIREMKRKETETAHEMELLKMKYAQERYEDESNAKIRAQQFELDKLKDILNHYENMGNQDIQRVGIQEAQATARKVAEEKYGYEHAREQEAYEERREQDRMAREERYSERADQLLSEMMAIQAAIQKFGLENDRVAIQEEARVEIARAQASQSKSAEIEKLLDEMKNFVEVTNKTLKEMKKSRKEFRDQADTRRGNGSQTTVYVPYTPQSQPTAAPYTQPYRPAYTPPYVYNRDAEQMNANPATSFTGSYRDSYTGSQPGTSSVGKVCPRCGASLTTHASRCWKCNMDV